MNRFTSRLWWEQSEAGDRFWFIFKCLFVVFVVAVIAGFFIWLVNMLDHNNKPENAVEVTQVKLPDGQTVTCVIYHAVQKGGISCDWGRVK